MSIASRIEAIEQHLTDDYSVLEVAGADLTNVDKNILNLKSTWQERLLYFMNNGTDVVWNNWDKVTGEGTVLTLNNTEEAPMKINLKGNTSQESTTGKNLANIYVIPNQTSNLTLTIANDKITISNNRNSAGYTGTGKKLSKLCPSLQVGDVAYLFFDTTSTLTNKNIIFIGETWTKGSSKTITQAMLDSNVALYGGYQETAIISNFMITKVNDSTYEPYTNGASPNPDYPQDIHVVSGDNSINVCGKNLFNGETELGTFNNSTGEKTTSTNTRRSVNKILVKPSTQYIFSRDGVSFAIRVYYYQKNGTYISTEANSNGIFTTPSNAYYVNFISDRIVSNYNDIQLEQGNQATTYEAYKSASYPITLPEGMFLGWIPNTTYRDRIFQATNGDSYYDSLTTEEKALLTTDNWYKHNVIGKIIFTGANTENWHQVSATTGHFYCTFRPYGTAAYPKLTNLYKFDSRKSGFAYLSNYTFGIEGTGTLHIQDNRLNSLTAVRNEFSTNNLILYYPLNEPTYTEITDSTLLSQLNALAKSYAGQTNISQENNDLASLLNATALKEMA